MKPVIYMPEITNGTEIYIYQCNKLNAALKLVWNQRYRAGVSTNPETFLYPKPAKMTSVS